MSRKIKTKYDDIVTYTETDEIKNKVFNKIVDYCIKTNCFSGECIYQDDEALIYAPELLSEIVDDYIKFEYVDKED